MNPDRNLSSLRCGAAVSFALPHVGLHIEHHDGGTLEVHKPPFDTETDLTQMGACGFRRAVAEAYRHRLTGRGVRFLGISNGTDPTLEYLVRDGELAFPGGILRVVNEGRWLHLIAVASLCEMVDQIVAEPVHTGPYTVEVATHADHALDVTILHVATDVEDIERSVAAVDALIVTSALVAVREFEMLLAESSDSSR